MASSLRTSSAVALLLCLAASCAAAAEAGSGQTLAVNGIELHYELSGSGEPLLLLHAGTQSGRMWDEHIWELAARYRVIVPDLRGHGGSTNPDRVWSTRQFAADIFALLDHLEVRRLRAVGASAGAMTLLHMAAAQPERFEALVVIGVGTYLPAACRSTLATVDADAVPADAMEELRAIHRHGDEQIRALYSWVASLASDETDMVFTPPQLARITAPTLVVHGDRDYCFPPSMALEIFDAIPRAYLWVVPNGGHVPIAGPRTETFSATVLEFLSGAWARD
jgi:pimeloyl-ACP methyl ester carboxylesterase